MASLHYMGPGVRSESGSMPAFVQAADSSSRLAARAMTVHTRPRAYGSDPRRVLPCKAAGLQRPSTRNHQISAYGICLRQTQILRPHHSEYRRKARMPVRNRRNPARTPAPTAGSWRTSIRYARPTGWTKWLQELVQVSPTSFGESAPFCGPNTCGTHAGPHRDCPPSAAIMNSTCSTGVKGGPKIIGEASSAAPPGAKAGRRHPETRAPMLATNHYAGGSLVALHRA